MANRIPLILDTVGENKLKELPVGDNLDLSGSSIINVQNLSVLGNLNAPDLIVSYNNLTNKPNIPQTILDLNIEEGTDGQVLSTDGDGNYTFVDPVIFELSVAKISELENDVGYITSAELDSIAINATGNLTGNIYSYDSTLLVDAENGNIDYSILINKPFIPTAIGDLEDDISLVTRNEFNSLGSNVSNLGLRVSNLEGSVSNLQTTTSQNSSAISSLQSQTTSLNSSIQTNSGKISTLENTVPQKAFSADISAIGFTGNYTDLINKPALLDLVGITDGTSGQVLTTNGEGSFSFTTVTSDGDYNNLDNLPIIPSDLTDLGITDGTDGQVLTTDGAGNFTFTTVTSGGTAYDQSLNTTDDVEFNSVTADSFVSSGTGTPSITSTTNIDLDAGNAINFKIAGGVEAFIDATGFNVSASTGDVEANITSSNVNAQLLRTTTITHRTDAGAPDTIKIGSSQTSDINLDATTIDFGTGTIVDFNNASVVNLSYVPTTPTDWNGTPPTTVVEALDRLATLVKALNSGTGA